MRIVPIAVIATCLLASCNIKTNGSDSYGDTDTVFIKCYDDDSLGYAPTKFRVSNYLAEYNEYALMLSVSDDNEPNNEDMYNKDRFKLVRYVKGISTDSCYLVGPWNRLIPEGGSLMIIVAGVDTIALDFTKRLPKSIDTRFYGILAGCKTTCFSRHYSINDSACTTDFQINIGLKPNSPKWIKSRVRDLIHTQIELMFDMRVKIDKHALVSDFPDKMIRAYYKDFKRLYLDFCEGYYFRSIQIFIYPVWESQDKSMVTYYFFTYTYNGGIRGWNDDYFITFDSKTGRELLWNDFYTKNGFIESIRVLERKLYNYPTFSEDSNGRKSAAFGVNDTICIDDTSIARYANPKDFPQPAITKKGMVFTYPVYEKGAAYDGVIHLTVPYHKVK